MDARWLMSLALLGAGEAARAGPGSDNAPVAALSKLGARVECNPTAPDKPVIAVDRSSTRVTDAGLERLEGLGGLETLYLVSTNVTDAGLVPPEGPRPPHGGVAERDRGDRPGNRRPGEGGSQHRASLDDRSSSRPSPPRHRGRAGRGKSAVDQPDTVVSPGKGATMGFFDRLRDTPNFEQFAANLLVRL